MRIHLGEYLLFLVLTWIVWAGVDVMRFLLMRTEPGPRGFEWTLGGFTFVWMAAWLVREVTTRVARARDEESRELAVQVPAQEMAQNS